MSNPASERARVLDTLGRELGRELSTRVVLFHQALADAVGLNATDHKALDLIVRTGPLTAGAVTGIIDRLATAGFVERERDPHDRRRVILHACPPERNTMFTAIESLNRAMQGVCERYTDQELEVISDWITQTIQVLRTETTKLRDTASAPRGPTS
jgi:DNA-binding MarR family transcriptional regulator